ncbi:Mitochondrial substrate/solute carrier [Dillenia turbinata]|uniref:Mitochondrial substrate/solute carrier n=1 Tax=Dillenia turbinata TaxID=194707 RepID=A0AAN8ZMS6_9MAGN
MMEEFLRNHIYATHAIAGAGSAAFATALAYPLDTLKVLIQVGSASGKQLTATQALYRLYTLSGISGKFILIMPIAFGLYSGLGLATAGRILGIGTRFGVYELLTAFYKDGREDNYVYVSEALLAGIAAGSLEPLVSSPFEISKLRAQVAAASRMSGYSSFLEKQSASSVTAKLLPKYAPGKMAWDHSVDLLSTLGSKHPNLHGALQEYPWMMTGSGKPPSLCDVRNAADIISLEGWGTLWRGIRSGVVRDSVFGGIFFSCWQFLHRAMLDWKAVGMDPIPSTDEEVGPLPPLATCLAAGFSASVAAVASHSFDTARSRSQCTVIPRHVSMERRLLKWKLPGKRFERLTGIHPSDRNLLFRGIQYRMARSGLASFMIVGGYYLAVDHLLVR